MPQDINLPPQSSPPLMAQKCLAWSLPKALKDAILNGNSERYGADANVAHRVPADEHVFREPHLAEIEAQATGGDLD